MNAELLPGTFPVSREFDSAAFDCGVPVLNDWLKKFALRNHANLSAKTFTAPRGTRIVGYYSLTVTSAERDEPPERVTKGLARIPCRCRLSPGWPSISRKKDAAPAKL